MKNFCKRPAALLSLVCVLLLLGNVYQHIRFSILKTEVGEVGSHLEEVTRRNLEIEERMLDTMQKLSQANERIAELEADAQKQELIRSYLLTIADVDTKAASVTVHLRAEVDTKDRGAEAVLLVIRQGESLRFPLEQTADGVYEGRAVLDMKGAEQGGDFQIIVSENSGNRAGGLCTLSNLTQLLELKRPAISGDAVYENGALIFTDWTVDAAGAKAGTETLRLCCNGELAQELPLSAVMEFAQECSRGDTVELRYAARDEWGIGYEYSLKWWEITEKGAAVHWPLSAYPVLTWEE